MPDGTTPRLAADPSSRGSFLNPPRNTSPFNPDDGPELDMDAAARALIDENTRLRAQLAALRARAAAANAARSSVGKDEARATAASDRDPDQANQYAAGQDDSVNDSGAWEAAGSAEGAANSDLPPRRLRIPVPSSATPLLRAVVKTLAHVGNTPMGPAQIGFTIRSLGMPEDLGRLFDADPAASVFAVFHSAAQFAKKTGAANIFGKVKEGGKSGYFLDVPGPVTPGSTVTVGYLRRLNCSGNQI
jgi:hypothetical protein